ncbi:MAG TPA: tripartite tricarboxylate transporter TctB family protein [Hyphomicrobiales bacterium]|nr:tripartite tricarboxylate transporter TctB family protein [Hyphomicrobiales bacterium]
MFRVRSPQDFGAGVFFMLFGVAGLFFARNLAFGSTEHMGPGYFPVLLNVGIVTIGAVVALRALAVDGPPIEGVAWRGPIFVLASILLFAFLIERAGLVVTTAVLTLVAAYARREAKLLENLLLAAGLALMAVVLFVFALRQPMPIWWWG